SSLQMQCLNDIAGGDGGLGVEALQQHLTGKKLSDQLASAGKCSWVKGANRLSPAQLCLGWDAKDSERDRPSRGIHQHGLRRIHCCECTECLGESDKQ